MAESLTSKIWLLAKYFVIIVLILPIALAFFMAFFLNFYGADAAAVLFANSGYIHYLINYLPLLFFTFLFTITSHENMTEVGLFFSNKNLRFCLVTGIISGFVIFGVDIMFRVLDRFHMGLLTGGNYVGLIIALGIIAPFTEELIIRGHLQTRLMDVFKKEYNIFGLNIHVAVFLTVIFELLFHFVDWHFNASLTQIFPAMIYVFIFGIISSYIYQKTKSLTGPFIIHALGNIIELILIALII